jgi:hypothetical protein
MTHSPHEMTIAPHEMTIAPREMMNAQQESKTLRKTLIAQQVMTTYSTAYYGKCTMYNDKNTAQKGHRTAPYKNKL